MFIRITAIASVFAILTTIGCVPKSGTEIKTAEGELSYEELAALINSSNTNNPADTVGTDDTALIQYIMGFVDANPDHPKKAALLFKAADIYCQKSLSCGEALSIYDRIQNEFKGDPYAGRALFLQATLFINHFQKPDKGVQMMRRFLDQYPEHDLNEAAKQAIEVATLSQEELQKRIGR